MKEIWDDLKSSRSFWLCVMTIMGALEELLRGEVTPRQAALVVMAGLVGITMRHAIEKAGGPPPPPPVQPPSTSFGVASIPKVVLVFVLAASLAGCSTFDQRAVLVVEEGRALVLFPEPGNPNWDSRRETFLADSASIILEAKTKGLLEEEAK